MGIRTVLLGAMLGSFLTGFASSIISNTLGQPSWFTQMGLAGDDKKTTEIISAANGLFYAGGFFGTLFTFYFSERWGRLMRFKVAAAWAVIGGVLQTAAMNVPMYLVSRLLSGFATGQTTAAMMPYYSEISLPNNRGQHSGLHALMIEGGAGVASWIGVGCYYSNIGTFGWRFPISLSVLNALVLFIVTFYLPESPRWLIRKGRMEEAYRILTDLHKPRTPEEQGIADREFQQVKMQSELDNAEVLKHGQWQLFTDPGYRKRFFIGFGLVAFVQSCGILVIFNYGVLLLTRLGLNGAESLIALAGWITFTAVCILAGNLTVDWTGRRPSLIVGFIFQSISLAIFTACLKYYLETQEKRYAVASVTFIFVTAIPFGACLDNNQFTVIAEIFPNHMRSLACSVCVSALYLMQTLWLNLAPTAINDIEWKFYLVFVVLSACGAVYVYFLIPETKKIPLEELDAIFGRTVAVKLSALTDEKANSDSATHHEQAGDVVVKEDA
ncbi:general substrate transporter [Ilyonectria destructans]|nr:general substrate transporter [Ilyonectria destructans]